ncbi:hypothetical protein BBP40_000661 [Aspergillus hancockii]|nr:hypothetical protein BBP40_000661 [Aspergillus hancockii]
MPAAVEVASSVAIPDTGRFAVVGPTNKTATRPTKSLPESLVLKARNVEKEEFDPVRHVNHTPAKHIWSMADIGLDGVGISPTAVSEPFSLFAQDAVRQMRAEIFSEAVLEKCQVSSSFATNMIRGHDATLAPFIHQGTAVVMQGRYIEHKALKAFGGGERIAMATPFQPKSPFVRDDVVLTTVRPISYQDALYHQYAEYRPQTLKARIDWQLAQVQKNRRQQLPFDLEGVRSFLSDQQQYISSTLTEMVDYEN